jgi:hypothetical protein
VTIAALNLYGRDRFAMAPLLAEHPVVHGSSWASPTDAAATEVSGGRELLAGCAGALDVQATIQRAIGVIMAELPGDTAEAYATLRIRAAEARMSLPAAASDILGRVS